MSGEAVLAEVVEALEEPIAEVVCDVELLALALVLVVVEEPQREAVWIELLLKLFDTFSLLVLDVDEKSLEVEQVESSWRELIKRVGCLLLGLVLIIVITIVLRFSGFLSSWGDFLFFGLDHWFDCLSSNLDVSANFNESWKACNTLKPS